MRDTFVLGRSRVCTNQFHCEHERIYFDKEHFWHRPQADWLASQLVQPASQSTARQPARPPASHRAVQGNVFMIVCCTGQCFHNFHDFLR